jgi:hypothetical protein
MTFYVNQTVPDLILVITGACALAQVVMSLWALSDDWAGQTKLNERTLSKFSELRSELERFYPNRDGLYDDHQFQEFERRSAVGLHYDDELGVSESERHAGEVAALQQFPDPQPALANAPSASDTSHPGELHLTEWVLFAVGCSLLLFPVAVAAASPTVLINAQFFLKIIAALGGALLGGFIPGVLQVTLPGIKAVGALGVFALIYVTNPPVFVARAANPLVPPTASPESGEKTDKDIRSSPSTSTRLRHWLFFGGTIQHDNLVALQAWMQGTEFRNLPPEVLVSGDGADLERGRERAISALHVP